MPLNCGNMPGKCLGWSFVSKSCTIPVLPAPLLRENIPVLQEQFQLTNLAKQFLFFDRGVGEKEQIIIFSTQQGIQLFG